MNTNILIDRLKSKVEDTNEFIASTKTKQANFLKVAKELNFKLRNSIEGEINEKNMLADSNERISMVKTRIENCKQNINLIRDKIKEINIKYNKK